MLEKYFRTKPILTDHVTGKPLTGAYPQELMEIFPDELFDAASTEIPNWPGYGLTPLRSLDGLAGVLAFNAVHYKDESGRFGLGIFKALDGKDSNANGSGILTSLVSSLSGPSE